MPATGSWGVAAATGAGETTYTSARAISGSSFSTVSAVQARAERRNPIAHSAARSAARMVAAARCPASPTPTTGPTAVVSPTITAAELAIALT